MELTSLIIPILLLVVMYFLLIRPQQNVQKNIAMINRVEAGQRLLQSVVLGTIKAVDETSVIITVNSNGTEMTFENQL